MSTTYYYVRPTDSLFIRGNQDFGDGGEHGAGQMPPPPSLFAGAFRSALLGKDARQLADFLSHGQCSTPELAQCLGTPNAPGSFRIHWLSLAGESKAGDVPEPLMPLPADLRMLGKNFAALEPRPVPCGVQLAGDLPLCATLVSVKQEKPTDDIYLRSQGFQQYLQGQKPDPSQGIKSGCLYKKDPRLGIGMNAAARTVEEGQIYITEGYAFHVPPSESTARFVSTGFLVGMKGVADVLPDQGHLRLGGDGRSAHYRRVSFSPSAIVPQNGRFRLLLQTPALFTKGWLPDGVTQLNVTYRLQGDGFSARLACAALGRRDIISGWDMYQWCPKPAEAAVPAGSVYWFDEFEGEVGRLAEWVDAGLWPKNLTTAQKSRRAEGYNRAIVGLWN